MHVKYAHIWEMIYTPQSAIAVKLCTCTKTISLLNMHSVDECVHICSSLSVEAACSWLYNTQETVQT